MAESDCVSRQRLRPWLIAQINSGQIPGLYWLNEEKTKFKIPWKHAGKQDWNPSYSQIFTEWAKQRGNYREGIDKPDYVRWKTRLRCALHKAQDIEYLENESQTQEDHPEPYRVYEFKPQTNGKKKADNSKFSADTCTSYSQSTGELYLPYQGLEAPMPKMVAELNAEMSDGVPLPSDLTQLDSEEMRQLADVESISITVDSSIPSMSSVTMKSYDDKVANPILPIPFDVQQLVDSMSSITFDQAKLSASDCIPAKSQKVLGVEVFDPAADHFCDPMLASNSHHDLCGQEQPGQIMSLSQTPMTVASTPGVIFSQPVTFQPSPANSPYLDTTAALAPIGEDTIEQYGFLGLQDMLTSDEML